jgi:hypothetical protein
LDRCQAAFEKGAGADNGVETYMQTLEDGGDEELVFFLGDSDQGAPADHQHLKNLIRKGVLMPGERDLGVVSV